MVSLGNIATLLAFAAVFVAAVVMLELHGPEGQTVFINEREISALRAPTLLDRHRYFPKNVQCLVSTTNGKFYATTESCPEIYDRITGHKPS